MNLEPKIQTIDTIENTPTYGAEYEYPVPVDALPEVEQKDGSMENLEKLRSFFGLNEKIKREMIEMAPPSHSEIGYGDGFHYEEMLDKGLKNLNSQFNDVADDVCSLGVGINQDTLKAKKDALVNNMKLDLEQASFDFNNLSKVYAKDISDIDPEFVKLASSEISGYFISKDFGNVLKKVNTLNELLHLVHMQVQSSEHLYEKLPKWGEFHDGRIKYDAYGEKTAKSSEIFESVSSVLKNERTDVLGNHIPPTELMHMFTVGDVNQLLVRDSGHALSVQVDTSDTRAALISYTIPKLINIDVVNSLPGVRKVEAPDEATYKRVGTTGRFEVPYENLGKAVADFIIRVPTDEMLSW